MVGEFQNEAALHERESAHQCPDKEPPIQTPSFRRIRRGSTAGGSKSTMTQSRSWFGERLFHVTALTALISHPGGRDFRSAIYRLPLQRRDRGRLGRFSHDGVAGRTFLHQVTSGR